MTDRERENDQVQGNGYGDEDPSSPLKPYLVRELGLTSRVLHLSDNIFGERRRHNDNRQYCQRQVSHEKQQPGSPELTTGRVAFELRVSS